MEARTPERRSVVASGKTVEDAIKNGLTMLGARREQVDVEVISEGSRGVLGFGAENARVRLELKQPPAPRPAEPEPAPPVPPTRSYLPAAGGRGEGRVGVTPPTPEPKPAGPVAEAAPAGEEGEALPVPASAPEQVGSQVVTELLGLMGIRAGVEAQAAIELTDEDEAPTAVLNLTGEDLGILIGRRGETLRAMQYLVRLMVSHRTKHWANLVIDVESYRVRRLRTLENLAKRVAEEVARTGRSQALEPMPPDERRQVHIALRSHPKVMTQSIGEGERRKVTIVPRR